LEKGKCFPSHGPASGPWPIAPLGQQPVKRPGRDRHDLLAPAEKGEVGQTTSDDRGQGWRSGAHQQSATRRLAGREKGKGTTGGKVGTSKWGTGGRSWGGPGTSARRTPTRRGRAAPRHRGAQRRLPTGEGLGGVGDQMRWTVGAPHGR
jgi:hypothetical protein